ncbi:hypothetical protein CLCR_03779 [Cladophialophora carrionii]|uniref:Uncharacterized protein n=1 Tax=Cladophialophora carrionii TaxID=86049 RepID=A0A1C1CFZ2_9EURO|nr:hypothetical protein CLCR_03779 [Cladophialophora carrionii]
MSTQVTLKGPRARLNLGPVDDSIRGVWYPPGGEMQRLLGCSLPSKEDWDVNETRTGGDSRDRAGLNVFATKWW